MRVIAGIRKGLKLKAPEGMDTRPTTDRVKESVFNILQQYIPSDSVLDLFAGSGALGIEALSRRCGHCTFVECDRRAYALVSQNVNTAGFDTSSALVFSKATDYLERCSEVYDLIFLDPPYNKGFLTPVIKTIWDRSLISENGVIVVETEKDGEEFLHQGFDVVRRAVYGKTVITVLKRGEV